MQMRNRFYLHAVLGAALWMPRVAAAVPFTGSILVQNQIPGTPSYQITEYRLDGTKVQTLVPPPAPNPSDGLSPRDLVMGGQGELYLYNGTFDPYLLTYDPGSDTWSHTTHAGWSTMNNGSYGGIARYGTRVFVTDMETAGSPSSGVVVFDTAQGTSQEFASGLPATDLNLGLDGKLWVLAGGTAYSYDPTTLSALDSISLAAASVLDIRSLAVDAVGDFYLATWNGFIVHLAGDGSLVESLSVVPGLHDIDIAPNGLLIFGSGSNGAWLSDTTLSGAHQIQTGGWQTFVAFVPEPGTGMLVGIGLVAFARNGRRGSRASTRLRRWIVGG